MGISHLANNTTKGGVKMVINIKNFTRVGDSVKPEDKRRVGVHADLVREYIIFHIHRKSIGQILLDHQVTIPASELW